MVSGLRCATTESTSLPNDCVNSFQAWLICTNSEEAMQEDTTERHVERHGRVPGSSEDCKQVPQCRLPASWRTHFSSRRTCSDRASSLEESWKD